ncbi:MAG: DNA polymerase III subunit chi [Deltaproteobacteria bacterium]|nr:DNA polymerase III subunit chi [Deltaproteobacteria bacterium]
MSPRVVFYDVDPDAWEGWIHKLAAAAWERNGARLMILVGDPERAEEVDQLLWSFREESFLPHEVVHDGQPLTDPEARVLISWNPTNPHQANLLALDAPAELDFASGFEVVMDVVDRRSDERLVASRERFKAWRARGVSPEHRGA